jgi:hypothetical protein
LFEAKTNKTWLELDEKEFEELILGAKGPEGHTFSKKPLDVPPPSKPVPPPSEPTKAPVPIFTQTAYTPPPTPPLPGLNKEPSLPAKIHAARNEDLDTQVKTHSPVAEPETKPSNSPSNTEEADHHNKEKSDSSFDAAGEEKKEGTSNSEVAKETRFVRESAPKLPFRKRSDQLYVTRQIYSLVHSIPKADLEERMKSEAISALKAIEDLLVEEVTEKERRAAKNRLEVIIWALDHDLEFAVNVASYLPPIYTYFGLEID